jgi:hypothetical protein
MSQTPVIKGRINICLTNLDDGNNNTFFWLKLEKSICSVPNSYKSVGGDLAEIMCRL